MLCYCVVCAEKIPNLGEPHACTIQCYGCHALLDYIGEPHDCPVDIEEQEDDEGFEDQIDFVYEKLKDLAVRILTGEDIVFVYFKNRRWVIAVIRNTFSTKFNNRLWKTIRSRKAIKN